jgi:hypothetical protein
MLKLIPVTLALLAALALPAPLFAQGNSTIDQYGEAPPGAGGGGGGGSAGGGGGTSTGGGSAGGGDTSTGGGTSTGGSSGDGGSSTTGGAAVVPDETAAELEAAGSDGQATADLAQETAPATAGSQTTGGDSAQSGGGNGQGEGAGGGGDAGEDSSLFSDSSGSTDDDPEGIGGVIDAVLTGATDTGMGVALPIILVAALVGAIGVLVARRRGYIG